MDRRRHRRPRRRWRPQSPGVVPDERLCDRRQLAESVGAPLAARPPPPVVRPADSPPLRRPAPRARRRRQRAVREGGAARPGNRAGRRRQLRRDRAHATGGDHPRDGRDDTDETTTEVRHRGDIR